MKKISLPAHKLCILLCLVVLTPFLGSLGCSQIRTEIAPTPSPTETPLYEPFAEKFRLGNGHLADIALSPDGQVLALAGSLGVWLYDFETLTLLGRLDDGIQNVKSLAWSPDGARLAAGSTHGVINIWDVRARKVLFDFKAHSQAVSSLDWSPDGIRLASGSVGELHIWDTNHQKMLQNLDKFTYNNVTGLAWSPDGTKLAAGDGLIRYSEFPVNYALHIWKTDSWELEKKFPNMAGWVYSLSWSPDGKELAAVGAEIVYFWDTLTWSQTRLISQSGFAFSVAWSPNGQWIASTGEETRIYPADASSESLRLAVNNSESTYEKKAVWTPDGKKLVSLNNHNLIRVWDAESGSLLNSMQEFTAIDWMSVNPSVTQVASISPLDQGLIQIYELPGGQLLHNLEMPGLEVYQVLWAADGQSLAALTLNGQAWVWDIPRGEVQAILQFELSYTEAGDSYWSTRFHWSPSGVRLAFGGKNSELAIWDRDEKDRLISLEGHTRNAENLQWSPDGRYLSAEVEGVFSIWASETGKRVLHTLPDFNPEKIGWSPDSRYLTFANFEENIIIWESEVWENVQTVDVDQGLRHRGKIAWSPQGDLLAAI
ncbi:MAG: hypothetical protein OEZ02_02925, partial [Anaerolineae bacterium]|nr:hypothetical protein [Anaerolineae bacterium]